jgi:glycosyltransferase involved in cell wall biosynthesis
MIKHRLLKLRTRIRRIFPFKPPLNWDEKAYLAANPDVKAAKQRGFISSGFEHWKRRGALEGRAPGGLQQWQQYGNPERRAPHVPKWVRKEMLALSEIEPKLFPSTEFCARLTEYSPARETSAGRVFGDILKKLGDQSFTHIFLLPWLKPGGADLEALHHIRTLSNKFGARVLVIFTEDATSSWVSRLPPSVPTLRFGRATAGIDPITAQVILARLLLKLKPTVIHNVNSAIGWELFCHYGAALRSESKLYASVFCFDYTLEGEPVGYARELERAAPYLQGVFCDNRTFAVTLNRMYGIDPSLFSVIRYPVRAAPRFMYVRDDRPLILWAGRMDWQKRPDILKRIAEALPTCIFHLYGGRVLDSSPESLCVQDDLADLENVIVCGPYDSFDVIPAGNYALFLYTTQWDGMPNVILEALASGLAVLAPNVGGISEVIPPDSGFLVPRFDDVSAYIDAIRRFISNPHLISEERDKRVQFLREQYSQEQFVASLGGLKAYSLQQPPFAEQRNEPEMPTPSKRASSWPESQDRARMREPIMQPVTDESFQDEQVE